MVFSECPSGSNAEAVRSWCISPTVSSNGLRDREAGAPSTNLPTEAMLYGNMEHQRVVTGSRPAAPQPSSAPRAPISVGVVGLGYWGPNLVRNFASSDEYRLIAVCDQHADRLQKISASFP